MRPLLSIYCLVLVTCNTGKDSYIQNPSRVTCDNQIRCDSLKWLFYAVNYSGVAKFIDTVNKLNKYFKPIECEVELVSYNAWSEDSSFYLFEFVKNDLQYGNMEGVANYIGFKVVGNQ